MDPSEMSNVEEFPSGVSRPSEFESLVEASPTVLDAIPGAVYLCDRDGWLIRYNSEAIALWGRTPNVGGNRERFCGSHRLFLPDGTPLLAEDCPMADAIRSGTATRNAEVLMERPDGTRFTALVNIRPLKDHRGNIQGAINCFQDTPFIRPWRTKSGAKQRPGGLLRKQRCWPSHRQRRRHHSESQSGRARSARSARKRPHSFRVSTMPSATLTSCWTTSAAHSVALGARRTLKELIARR